jgi:hypothetical protein
MKAALAWSLAVCVAAAAGYGAGRLTGAVREVLSAAPPDGGRIAFVRQAPCGRAQCQTLWLGNTRADATAVAALGPGERCEEIAWARDGYRMGFLVNGYLLRVYNLEPRAQIAQITLIPPDGTPSSHLARGVTFSTNGAAVTFDNCPRYASGCRSGFAAVR